MAKTIFFLFFFYYLTSYEMCVQQIAQKKSTNFVFESKVNDQFQTRTSKETRNDRHHRSVTKQSRKEKNQKKKIRKTGKINENQKEKKKLQKIRKIFDSKCLDHFWWRRSAIMDNLAEINRYIINCLLSDRTETIVGRSVLASRHIIASKIDRMTSSIIAISMRIKHPPPIDTTQVSPLFPFCSILHSMRLSINLFLFWW